MKPSSLLLALALALVAPHADRQAHAASAQSSSALSAPPMGWNSWNAYGCDIDETRIITQAEAMAQNGMREAGYRYVVIDDCWSLPARDAAGNLQADPKKFPSGMRAVADRVHALGLKFGMYSDRGTKTCGGFPGSQDHERQDAAQFARWGVDYLKYDNCYATLDERSQYRAMREALSATGRPIVFSVCSWWFRPWIPEIGDLWRTTYDIRDAWTSNALPISGDNQSVTSIADSNNLYASYARPGRYNDPDMLMVGNRGAGGLGGPGMNDTEYRSHFGLWAIMSAPLMAGNRLASMDAATLETLGNEEVIAVNQSPADAPEHTQGVRVRRGATLEVWAKPLADGSFAVLLLNRSDAPADLRLDWADVGFAGNPASVRDLWRRRDLGPSDGPFTAKTVPAHGSVMLRATGAKRPAEAKTTVTIEAEAKANTITEPLEVRACEGCSGGKMVANIRAAGTLTFNRVFASRAGSVPVTVDFVGVSREALVKVTTGAGGSAFVRVHSSNETITSLRLNLELERGDNTIGFSLPGARAPSVDRIRYETGRR